jgi:diguanylate cyclase (GGDEF)-like protein
MSELQYERRNPQARSTVGEVLQEERSLYSTQFTLGFRSLQFMPELEQDFRQHYLQQRPGWLRRTLPVGVVLALLFSLADFIRVPLEVFDQLLPLRLVQFGALAAFAIVLYLDIRPLLEITVCATLIIYGISTPIMLGIINESGAYASIAAQLFIIVFCYFLTGLRFVPAMIVAAIITGAYPASQVLFDAPLPNMAINCYALLLFNLLGLTGAYYVEYTTRENYLGRQLMEDMALYDGVTSMPNRVAFTLDLDKLCRQARRDATSVSVAMIDVDNFMEFNDYFGLPQGDQCLRKIASALRGCMRRPFDTGGRYGGEEFVLAWYDCDSSDARALAERARFSVQELAIPHGPSTAQRRVTVSIGVASNKPGDVPDAQDLLRAANKALAYAKKMGRNRVALDIDSFTPRPL